MSDFYENLHAKFEIRLYVNLATILHPPNMAFRQTGVEILRFWIK